MSWKTNKSTGKKFQSQGRGIDAGTFGNLNGQDKNRILKGTRLPKEAYINKKNWGMTIENGKITHLSIDDFGWMWSGDADDINGFIARLARSKVESEVEKELEFHGITFNMLKPLMLKNMRKKSKTDITGLYELTGDEGVWTHGNGLDIDMTNLVNEWFVERDELDEDLADDVATEAWSHYSQPSFADFYDQYGKTYKKKLEDIIASSNSFDEFAAQVNGESFKYSILEDTVTLNEGMAIQAIKKAIKEDKKKN